MQLPPEVDQLRQATAAYLAALRAAQMTLPDEPAEDPIGDWLYVLHDHIDEMLCPAGGTPEGLRLVLDIASAVEPTRAAYDVIGRIEREHSLIPPQ